MYFHCMTLCKHCKNMAILKCTPTKIYQGECLTVARGECISPRASGTPSPLARRASDHDIRFYNEGYSIIMFTNSTAHMQRKETGIQGMLFSAN